MAVYVDGLRQHPGWKWPSCHLTADSLQELLCFGEMLGLKRGWLQRSNLTKKLHFDITRKNRERAIRMGAVVLRGEGK